MSGARLRVYPRDFDISWGDKKGIRFAMTFKFYSKEEQVKTAKMVAMENDATWLTVDDESFVRNGIYWSKM